MVLTIMMSIMIMVVVVVVVVGLLDACEKGARLPADEECKYVPTHVRRHATLIRIEVYIHTLA